MAESKDKFVRLVNLSGVEEDVWDFADHVERLLGIGWSMPVVAESKVINKTNKEQV